jgi:NAD(P)-dependent dehydrogenase (short-subunit alcohol dehydrogenase family)
MKKILLVTGGSRGIGAAISRLAVREGYAVAINYRANREAALELVDKIRSEGGEAVAIQGDTGVELDVIRLFNDVDSQLGKITALVNNAGIINTQSGLEGMDGNRLKRIFDVNSIGPFLCCREAVKRMAIRNGGSGGAIVNISSTAIKQGGPFEYIDYAASKGALEVLTIGLAKEVAGEGIRVNAVRPGIVYTDIHANAGDPGKVDRAKAGIPMKRGGQPEEVAKAVLWLLSDEASYSTGAILDVSGGR